MKAEWWMVSRGTQKRMILVVGGRIAAESEEMNPFGSNNVGKSFEQRQTELIRHGYTVELIGEASP